jgi:uroporphyrinogen-III synthase
MFFHRCVSLGISPDYLGTIEVAAVGRKTEAELERLKLRVQLIPEEFTASSLVRLLAQQGVGGKRILVPQGSLARTELVQGLRDVGAEVHPVTVYQTIAADARNAGPILDIVRQGRMDVVTFASPSAVQNFAQLLPERSLVSIGQVTTIAVIGPTTAQAIRDLRGTPVIVAADATAVGLVKAIVSHYLAHL